MFLEDKVPKAGKSKLSRLIKILIQSNPLMSMHTEAIEIGIRQHRTPLAMVNALILFQDLNLFSGELARDNFKKAIRFKCPEEMAEATRIFMSTISHFDEDEKDLVLQDYFNHIIRHDNTWFTSNTADCSFHPAGFFICHDKISDWLNIAMAFNVLYYETDLLEGPYERLNFDALLTPDIRYIATALSHLQRNTELLTGPFAQSNFDLLVNHRDPESLYDVLPLLLWWMPIGGGGGLLDGDLAQANFEALLLKPDLDVVLRRLYRVFNAELDSKQAQSEFDNLMRQTAAPRRYAHTSGVLVVGLFGGKGAVPKSSLEMAKPPGP